MEAELTNVGGRVVRTQSAAPTCNAHAEQIGSVDRGRVP
jgi:hypothetical protein